MEYSNGGLFKAEMNWTMFSNHEQKTTENGLKTGNIRLKTIESAARLQENKRQSPCH